ncbi:NUDIX hydrolase [Frankia sp. Cas3]|uniref:NUDIX hydrolase n=1 Tax=Frankia sp. Cas3 TaxID=3073926 RepID=UPI002AD4DBBF|nr:NUDIX hydrolase [Frankia sp. Cas3]
MTVTNEDVTVMVRQYLDVYPDEAHVLRPLLDAATVCVPVASRTTMPGHVTCGAVVVARDGLVLRIRHAALGRWLLPGGHVEPSDSSLVDAALRELAEETGIDPTSAGLLPSRPVDIDAHLIPANPARGEPEHTHYDLRFLFGITAEVAVTIQAEEVTGYRWAPAADLGSRLGGRVVARLVTRTRSVPSP